MNAESASPAEARSGMPGWLPPVILAALALALQAPTLGQEALWADEYFSFLAATEPDAWASIRRLVAEEPHPPVYFLLLRATVAFVGGADWALRLPSLLAAVSAVPALWWAARRLLPGDRIAPAFAAGLLAISPMHFWYAQEARAYALQVLLGIGAVGFSAGRGRRDGPLAALCALLALYTHYHSVFFAAPIGVALLWQAFLDSDRRRSCAIAAAMLFVGALPAGWLALRQLRGGIGVDWLPARYTLGDFPDFLRAPFVGPFYDPEGFSTLSVAGLFGGCAAFALAVVQRRPPRLVLLLWVATFLVPVAISYLWKPIVYYGQRYLIIALPWWLLAMTAGIGGDGKLRKALRIVALVTMVAVQLAWLQDAVRFRQKPARDSVAEFLARQGLCDASVLVLPPRTAGLLARYATTECAARILPAPSESAPSDAWPRERFLLVAQRDPRAKLFSAVGRRTQVLALFETHRPGQELWVIEVASAE